MLGNNFTEPFETLIVQAYVLELYDAEQVPFLMALAPALAWLVLLVVTYQFILAAVELPEGFVGP